MTKNEYMEFHRDCCQRMMDITRRKNHDYSGGDKSTDPFMNFTAVERMGICSTEQGFLTRMMDKMARISTLSTGTQAQVRDESVEDTLLDLANYSILLLGYIKSRKAGK